MEKFRRYLKPSTPEYERLVASTDKYLQGVLLHGHDLFKKQEDGKMWLTCQCSSTDCRGYDRGSYSSARLYRLIQNSEFLQQHMNQNFKYEIECGVNVDSWYFFLDKRSYSCKLEKRHRTQQLVVMTRYIKEKDV